jgi:hypothetical protein
MKFAKWMIVGALGAFLVSANPTTTLGQDNGNGHGKGHNKHDRDDDNEQSEHYYKHHDENARTPHVMRCRREGFDRDRVVANGLFLRWRKMVYSASGKRTSG